MAFRTTSSSVVTSYVPCPPAQLKKKSSIVVPVSPTIAECTRSLSPSGVVVYLFFWLAVGGYATARYFTAASTLSLAILAAEVLAALRVAVYGLYILHKPRTCTQQDELQAGANLRIMIPCYNEALAIVQETVIAAAATELPTANCSKFIYLCVAGNLLERSQTNAVTRCDDGKDPAKRAWVELQLRGMVR